MHAPAPIEHGSHPPGTFTVGAAPRLFQPRVLVAAAVAAAGLVVLLVLAILACGRGGAVGAGSRPCTVDPAGDDQPGWQERAPPGASTAGTLRADLTRAASAMSRCINLADSGRFLDQQSAS